MDTHSRLQVERKFNELKKRWENTSRAIEKQKESVDKRLEKWRDFKDKHKSFVAWLSEFETRPGLRPVASTDISELQNQAEYVDVSGLASPHLTSPHLTSPHLTSPHLTSPHLILCYVMLSYLIPFHFISFHCDRLVKKNWMLMKMSFVSSVQQPNNT